MFHIRNESTDVMKSTSEKKKFNVSLLPTFYVFPIKKNSIMEITRMKTCVNGYIFPYELIADLLLHIDVLIFEIEIG